MVSLNVIFLDLLYINMRNYRKIWEKKYGKIPKDETGRSMEIHHIDGNHNNNELDNLKLVTIEEHYNIHIEQNDFSAAALIGKRLKLPIDHFSSIQKGKKRPGVGGRKKGSIPWNKNKKNCFTPDTILKMSTKRKNKIHSSKLSIEKIKEIRNHFKTHKIIEKVGTKMKNGRYLTQERAYSQLYYKQFNITSVNLYNIVKGLSWKI